MDLCMRPSCGRLRRAFTLVELLVVITIIGILAGLVLPSIQGVRETARKSACANNVRNLGLAVQQHVAKHGHYPTGGWGYMWLGDPERGFGQRQPGGWVYNLLPFLDEGALHDLPLVVPNPDPKKPRTVTPEEKKSNTREMAAHPLPVCVCPSRRSVRTHALNGNVKDLAYNADNDPSGVNMVAKGDYAICAGSQNAVQGSGKHQTGPATLTEGDTPSFWNGLVSVNGISFVRSMVTPAQVRDGEAYTILIGETYLRPEQYNTDLSDNPNAEEGYGNNHTLYSGCVDDNSRCTYPYDKDSKGKALPTGRPARDASNVKGYMRFGSSHTGSCNFVFCDDSVRAISYNVDPLIFQYLGDRADGQNIDLTGF